MKRIFKFMFKSCLVLYAVLVTVFLLILVRVDYDARAFTRIYNERPTPDIIEARPRYVSIIGSQISSDLSKDERESQALKIVEKDGRYFWESQGNRELTKIVGHGLNGMGRLYHKGVGQLLNDYTKEKEDRKYTVFTSVDLDGFIIIKHDNAITTFLGWEYKCTYRGAGYLEFRLFKDEVPKIYGGGFAPDFQGGHNYEPSFYPPLSRVGCGRLMNVLKVDNLKKQLGLD